MVRFVPLAFASLLTGIVQSLGARWGLFRHYWIVGKLLIMSVATLVLLAYMKTFRLMAAVAADQGTGRELVRNESPVVHAVYKPWGMTPFGRRRGG